MKMSSLKAALIAGSMLACLSALSPTANADDISSASATSIPLSLPTDATTAGLSAEQIRAIVRDEIQKNPKLIMDALNSYVVDQQKAKEQSARDNQLAAKALLTVSEGYPVTGNPDGKVSVFYFYDVNCHYCKNLEPELQRFVKDNPDVRLVYREMPILAPSSHYAAQVNGVFFEKFPKKYLELHKALMKLQPGMSNSDIDRAVIDAIGPDAGAKLIQEAADPANDPIAKAVSKRIAATMATATKAVITGTPYVFVDGSDAMLPGADEDAYNILTKFAQEARAGVKDTGLHGGAKSE